MSEQSKRLAAQFEHSKSKLPIRVTLTPVISGVSMKLVSALQFVVLSASQTMFEVRPNAKTRHFLMISHHLEFLHPMTRFVTHTNLGHIDVTFGIHRHRVTVRKFSGLVARSAKSRQDFTTGVIENIHLFVFFV